MPQYLKAISINCFFSTIGDRPELEFAVCLTSNFCCETW